MMQVTQQTYVFFDSNVFIHCRPVNEMDLVGFLQTNDVAIGIAPIVIDELDKIKDNPTSSRKRTRAREALKIIEQSFDNIEIKTGVSLIVSDLNIVDELQQNDLDPTRNDNRLVATVLAHQKQYPSARTILLTHDVGPHITGKRFNIEVMEPPSQWQLPLEEDPIEKENRKLRLELERELAARPKLILRLVEMADSENHIAYRLTRPSVDKSNHQHILSELKQKYSPTQKAYPSIFLSSAMFGIDDQQRYEYEQNVEQFYLDYEAYLNELSDFLAKKNRTIPMNFELRNIGSKPAVNIDLTVHFPDGFALYTEAALPTQPPEPKVPERPKSAIELMAEQHSSLYSSSYLSQLSNLTSPPTFSNKPSTFSLRKTNSYELKDSWERLKHHHVIEIQPLYLIFDSFDSASSFSITYSITADNVTTPVDGELNIKVEID